MNIEKRKPKGISIDRASGIVDVFDQKRIFAAVLALDKMASSIKPRRIERPQDVVAASPGKRVFGECGSSAVLLAKRQFRIQGVSVPLSDRATDFQRRIGAAPAIGSLKGGRDVGNGDERAAARASGWSDAS